jgi:hypothetical protein
MCIAFVIPEEALLRRLDSMSYQGWTGFLTARASSATLLRIFEPPTVGPRVFVTGLRLLVLFPAIGVRLRRFGRCMR